MIQDIDVKAMKKNAFRVSKERGMTASRVRVPGGLVSAKSMARIVEIAEEYGGGRSSSPTAREWRSRASTWRTCPR